MSQNKNSKSAVWMYAIILFTSAFIVLLVTAYSQIKFSKNILDYKNQIDSHQKSSINFKMNLGLALEENKRLTSEIEILQNNISESNKVLEQKEKEIYDVNKQRISASESYETLFSALSEYRKGNYIKCAEILRNNIDVNSLEKAGQEEYNFLVDKSFKEAAKQLYKEGRNYYKKKMYTEASEALLKSYNFSPDEYFADDCLYYLAYSKLNLKNTEAAKRYFEAVVKNYPDSSYLKEVKILLEKLSE